MKRAVVILMLGGLLMVQSSALAQSSEAKTSSIFKADDFVKKPDGFLKYLINPAKFEMQQSYTLSFTSFGGRGYNQGLYLNTMNYRFSDPLMMQVRIGYLHQPLGGNQLMSEQNGKVFLQRAMLQYKPAENMSITFDYESYPSPLMSPTLWER